MKIKWKKEKEQVDETGQLPKMKRRESESNPLSERESAVEKHYLTLSRAETK